MNPVCENVQCKAQLIRNVPSMVGPCVPSGPRHWGTVLGKKFPFYGIWKDHMAKDEFSVIF